MTLKTEWQKSRRSEGNGACVEVRLANGVVQIRDSKDPGGLVLTLSPPEWAAFLAYVRESDSEL
jgi:uncharacterized protein DUF397